MPPGLLVALTHDARLAALVLCAEHNRFNEVTHETTYTDPDEYGGSPTFSPHPCPVGASPGATPFDGSMSPAGYHPGNSGYMSPPPAMVPPANGYMSPAAAGAYMSPNADHRQQHHHHHHQPQHDYPVETRSPCFTRGGRLVTPQQFQYVQRQQPQGRVGASMAPFGATSNTCSGYRWEECYKQIDGKKFWRHKETGVILTKDPYR